MRTVRVVAVAGIVAMSALTASVSAAGQGGDLSTPVGAQTAGPPAELRFNKRPIVTFRATVFSRPPAERVAGAVRTLDTLVSQRSVSPVATRTANEITLVTVAGRDVFGIVPQDVDPLTGETPASVAAEVVGRLQLALDEAVESRTPARLIWGAERSGAATLVFVLLLWAVTRAYRVSMRRLPSHAERRLQRMGGGAVGIVAASRAAVLLRFFLRLTAIVMVLFFAYNWLTYVLRTFAYTRPWGESLRAFLTTRLTTLGLQVVYSLPDLLTVVLIGLATRFVVGISNMVFEAVEDGRMTVPWLYPETAQPTRRLVATLLWLTGLVVAYPYLPGSDSEAFKGVSVFIGLMISLGSSSVVNQMMSGLTITYSRSLRIGDFAQIGDVEGTVMTIGPLSTKIKTVRREEVTIPNAVVVSNVTKNYSRFHEAEGVFFSTVVTIGYDTPWRQVHALLLLAAGRTDGIRKTPAPVVRQTALQDFYVQYTLLVSVEDPARRPAILDALHANIQDAFNEFDVQIMSPNYEADPEGRKTVPKAQWYAAPAAALKPGGAGRVDPA